MSDNTKVVVWSCNSKKDRQFNGQKIKDNKQTMVDITLHKKLKPILHKPTHNKDDIRCSGIVNR